MKPWCDKETITCEQASCQDSEQTQKKTTLPCDNKTT